MTIVIDMKICINITINEITTKIIWAFSTTYYNNIVIIKWIAIFFIEIV